jgi:hypothetical protein
MCWTRWWIDRVFKWWLDLKEDRRRDWAAFVPFRDTSSVTSVRLELPATP